MVADDADLTTEQIVDELISLLMAAQEPPAIALAWILDRLSREPEPGETFASANRLLTPRSRRWCRRSCGPCG